MSAWNLASVTDTEFNLIYMRRLRRREGRELTAPAVAMCVHSADAVNEKIKNKNKVNRRWSRAHFRVAFEY